MARLVKKASIGVRLPSALIKKIRTTAKKNNTTITNVVETWLTGGTVVKRPKPRKTTRK